MHCHIRYCVALIMTSLLPRITQNEPVTSLFCCSSTDAPSRHQFSPRVAPTSGVRLSERLSDPQSAKGAEQVTAHSKMSRPLYNPCMYSPSRQLYPSPCSQVCRQDKKVRTLEGREWFWQARLASCKRLAWTVGIRTIRD